MVVHNLYCDINNHESCDHSEVTGIGSHDVEMVDQLSDELLHHLVHYK